MLINLSSDVTLCILWGIFTSYSDIFSDIVPYLEPCVTLAYLEPCHIQNPSIFRTQDKFKTLSRHILAYPERCVTLAHWEPFHIQNFAIFRILAYLEPEAYSESCLYTLSDKKVSDKIFAGQNFPSGKTFVNHEKFSHFCPTKHFVRRKFYPMLKFQIHV